MSNSRHSGRDTAAVRTFGLTFHSPSRLSWPTPGWDQLIHATQGSLTVETVRGTWIVAAHRGLWMPSGEKHEIRVNGPAAMRSVYFRARAARALPRHCCAVNVTPLLRELILRAVDLGALDRALPQQRRLAAVLLDEVRALPDVPLQLPMPRDTRAAKAATLLRADPAGGLTAKVARQAGASVRTLERLFQKETGIALGTWIRRMRLLHALGLLADGVSVTSVAAECGYESTSAFVSMFRKELGCTPGRYFRETVAGFCRAPRVSASLEEWSQPVAGARA